MAGTWKIDIEVSGFDRLRRKIREDPPFVAPVWKQVVEKAGQIGVREAQQRAPRRSGLLAASLISTAQKKPMPSWVRVTDTARARGRLYKRQSKKAQAGLVAMKYTKGYSYPAWQNYAIPKGKRRGSPHRGWFTQAMQSTQTRIGPLLSLAVKQIEAEWYR
jgi:hypothetical protein